MFEGLCVVWVSVCVWVFCLWWHIIKFTSKQFIDRISPFLLLFPLKGIREFGAKHAEKATAKINSGEEPGEVQGLLEQWLREGKMSRDEAIISSADMFFAGVHTVEFVVCFS